MEGVDGISFIGFTEKDVARHPLVQKIVSAYDRFERAAEEQETARRAAAAAEPKLERLPPR
jgi:phosphate starvation-inducible PhoH-like protein